MNRFEMIRRTLMWESVASAAKAKAGVIRDELTQDARAEYAEQGTAPTWRLPDIGTVSLPVSKETVYVSDETALTRWVEANAPAEIAVVYRIRPAYLQALLASVHAVDGLDGHVVADGEGTIIPGLAVREGGQPGSLSFRPSTAAKEVAAVGAAHLVDELEQALDQPIVLAEAPDAA